TPDLRSAAASTICYQLDNMFRLFDKALYEFNSNRSKAVECMHEIMTSEDKTILELAKVVDDNYKFRGEIEDEALL
ncbi:MAG TPA: hypothetical protein VMT35_06055, partial [Ignavibacteriaceae bacterium]|nr:hypothetical protein [Ignavibacteriaceae bacterium]